MQVNSQMTSSKRLFFLLIFALCDVAAYSVGNPLHRVRIDSGWQFALTDRNPMLFDVDFCDVTLPHDWSVEQKGDVGPFFRDGDYQVGFMKGGTAWYRKVLHIDRSQAGTPFIYFEGVYNQATVFLDGREVAKNHYGYHGFRVDLSVLRSESEGYPSETELLVKVENKEPNSRWYSGSGIYRHVWLEYQNEGFINPRDVFIKTESATESKAVVSFWVKGVRQFSRVIRNPKLWSPETPYLYTMRVGGNEFRYGIRTVELSPVHGLLLNGVPVLLKGGCLHHDLGLLGSASLDKAEDRRLQILKEQGYNAVRCSHNLQSEHFMQACDSIGLMVIDECFDQWYVAKNTNDYHNCFPDFYRQDLTDMILRDRNHPSVIMWSLGNEIPGRHSEKAQRAADQMRRIVRSLDDTRPVTAALCGWDNGPMDWKDDAPKAWRSLDVVGYNYLWQNYEADHDSFPELYMVATETYPKEAAMNWRMVERHPYVLGEFVWTASDYLGEAGIGHSLMLREGEDNPFFMNWPYFNGWCGDIDLIGQKKPQSYYRDVVWDRQPIAIAVEEAIPDGAKNIVSGWGWPIEHNWWGYMPSDSAGLKRTVKVYSKAQKVRLYLNKKVIGTQSVDSNYTARFQVAYEPGELRAVTYDGRKEGSSSSLHSFSEPSSLRVICDRTRLRADGQDLAFVTVELVDHEGNLVPLSDRKVTVATSARIKSQVISGNASPNDMESFRSTAPKFFEGRILTIIRTSDSPENFTVTFSAGTLVSQTLAFVVR
ncbi:MAG: DUF4982 domain-containing protein [Bacteroidaceae bacterium]|nr:DUF4982 domain-containing protein [Bacteroidaceae bacterium]